MSDEKQQFRIVSGRRMSEQSYQNYLVYQRNYRQTEKGRAISRRHELHRKRSPAKNRYAQKRRNEFNLKWRSINCSKCGSNDDCTTVWHHVDLGTKLFEISYNGRKGHSDDEIRAEILKCIPLCPSCHSKIHNPKGFKVGRSDCHDRADVRDVQF